MKKFLLSGAFMATFATYAFYQMFNSENASALTQPIIADNSIAPTTAPSAPIAVESASSSPADSSATPAPAPAPVSAPTPAPAPASAPEPVPTPKPKGQYSDGTYTGRPADAYYGTIQVKADVSGGKLTDVVFLQYPSDRSYSRYVNGQAMPYLKREAIAAQSAQVDIVSGATDSSDAFIQSLSSALSQAKA